MVHVKNVNIYDYSDKNLMIILLLNIMDITLTMLKIFIMIVIINAKDYFSRKIIIFFTRACKCLELKEEFPLDTSKGQIFLLNEIVQMCR